MAKALPIDCERYRNHLRPHMPEERTRLEASLKSEGCCDPLVVGVIDDKRYLVDGFNRKAICDELKIKYEAREITFESEDQILPWIESNARARRNQTKTERMYYLGLRYNREKGNEGAPNGNDNRSVQRGHNDHVERTCERIANEEQVSEKTVRRAEKLALALDDACKYGLAFLKWPILSERIKCGGDARKLVDHLNHVGAGGCQEVIEKLLASSPEKPVTERMIHAALEQEDEEASEEDKPAPKKPPPPISTVYQAMEDYWNAIEGMEARDRLEPLTALVARLQLSLIFYQKRLEETNGECMS